MTKILVESSDIAKALIRAMEFDNGCFENDYSYKPSNQQLKALILGIDKMRAVGCKFTDSQIEVLAAGEQTQQDRLIKKYDGAKANRVLSSIFDRDDEA